MSVICLYNWLCIIVVSKGQAPSAPPDFVPVLRQSVCYVVMAVIINERNEILMMQEAKSTCAGQWYLPAGRVEPNESITVCLNKAFAKYRTGYFPLNLFVFVPTYRKPSKEKCWKRQV